MIWFIVGAAVLAVLGLYLIWTAGRLDRIHTRVDGSRAVLEAELLRRSSVALDIAAGGLLDPASAVLLADAASRTRTTSDEFRYEPESDLTSVLVAMFGDHGDLAEIRARPSVDSTVDELAAACRRAAHARRLHNEIVRGAQRLRRKRLVRWFRLAGNAPLPEPAEFDDTIPPALIA